MSADGYPPQGYFELTAEDDMVVLRCSWPFDITADEWISINNCYRAAAYSKAVADAAARGGRGQAHGVTGGFLEITQENSGFWIEFSRPECGWHAASLQLHVGRPVAELFLQSLPFRLPWTLRRNEIPTAAANLKITLHKEDDDAGAPGGFDA
jgi:hypothetical protein